MSTLNFPTRAAEQSSTGSAPDAPLNGGRLFAATGRDLEDLTVTQLHAVAYAAFEDNFASGVDEARGKVLRF